MVIRGIILIECMHAALDELRSCGARAINLERLFNLRRGLTMADDIIPPRLRACVSDDEEDTKL